MSYILKQNNVEVARAKSWTPSIFGEITGTSYPRSVDQSYVWQDGDYWLGWEDDPAPPPPTQEEINAAKAAQSVTMRQARLALLQSGLLDQVNAAIAASGGAAQIEWEYASEVVRGSPLVQSLAAGLGLTNTQLDDLFTLAASL
jgi:hypothetical protein